jgi:CRISPR-associated protein Cas1
MFKLRQKFFSLDNLDTAWKKVASNKGCAGVDGETLEKFAYRKEQNLKNLDELLKKGDYRPLPLKQLFITTKKGTRRELRIPTVRDRIIQQALLQILHPIVEADFEDCSFAYRPHRSHQMAALTVAKWRDQGYDWVLDGDIVKYFDNILHKRLIEELKESVDLAWLVTLINAWITVPVLTEDGLIIPPKGIPQGAVISPLLANVYLDDFDEIVSDSDLKLIRYADDFVVLSRSRKRILQAQSEVRDILEEMGLELHPDKTEITNFKRGFRFLGQVFTEDLMIPCQPISEKIHCQTQPEKDFRLIHTDNFTYPTAMQLALLESLREKQHPIPPPLYVVLGYQVRPVEKVVITSKELAWSPKMASLYLVQQGTNVKKEQGRFILQPPKEESIEIPVREIERILIYGNIQISTSVIETCLNSHIPVIFLSQLGEYKGHLYSAESGDLDSQLLQFEYRDNPDFQLEMAKSLVEGKLRNSKQLLLRLNRKRRLETVAANITAISSHLETIGTVDSLDSLLGHEGNSAANYFSAWGNLLVNPGFVFSERNRRPPKDPVNSLLSFGYTLLFNNVMSLILAEGMNPYLGNLHRSQEKKPELALDLMEEFRSPITDSLVITLINKQVLKPTDFTYPDEEGGVYLTETPRRIFLREFEERMNQEVNHPDVQSPVSYRRAIHLQVQRYKHCLLESVPYQSFLRAH